MKMGKLQGLFREESITWVNADFRERRVGTSMCGKIDLSERQWGVGNQDVF